MLTPRPRRLARRQSRSGSPCSTANPGEFFLRTKEALFPGLTIAELFSIDSGPLHEEIVKNIINVNGEDHRRLRNLVNPALSPRAVDRYRPAMRGFLEQLLSALPDDGHCEFIADFAKPYPSLVIAAVMGAPLTDAPRLHHWSNWIQRQFDAQSLITERALIERAVAEFYAYEDELIRARRGDPGDDLISALIQAEEEGDRLSDDELRNLVLNILVGGVDTARASSRTRSGCSRCTPTSGSCCAATPTGSPSRPWRRRSATSRSRRSPPGSRSPRSSTGASRSRPAR